MTVGASSKTTCQFLAGGFLLLACGKNMNSGISIVCLTTLTLIDKKNSYGEH